MLATIVLTVAFFAICVFLMAIGLAVNGRRLAGSCGGVGSDSCGCSPEKRAACRKQLVEDDDLEDQEYSVNPLAPPGEERLLKLRVASTRKTPGDPR